jgi:hypothetical protein
VGGLTGAAFGTTVDGGCQVERRMTWLLRIGRPRLVHIVMVSCTSGLSPSVVSAECPRMTVSQGMAMPTTVAVFSGTVSDIEEGAGAATHLVTFDVHRVWKGTLRKRVSLYQSNTSDAIPFSAGVPYLIVAYRLRPEEQDVSGTIRRAATLGIVTCASITLEHAERRGDLREIGQGRVFR